MLKIFVSLLSNGDWTKNNILGKGPGNGFWMSMSYFWPIFDVLLLPAFGEKKLISSHECGSFWDWDITKTREVVVEMVRRVLVTGISKSTLIIDSLQQQNGGKRRLVKEEQRRQLYLVPGSNCWLRIKWPSVPLCWWGLERFSSR